MIISYEYFKNKLNETIKSNDEFYYELLKKIIDKPDRYTGTFRYNNQKTKLIQNATQSIEIKFGDFMEDIITDYLEIIGKHNLDKKLRDKESGKDLNIDQLYDDGKTVFMIEQKIRDDHDSSKKEGQYENFKAKYSALKRIGAYSRINAIMWFIDDRFRKNRHFYNEKAKEETSNDVDIKILYGRELFTEVLNRPDIWDEICLYLEKNKEERKDEVLTIPDFDTSEEIYRVLKKLKENEPSLYRRLLSDKDKYIQLRKELFPTEYNLRR